MENWRKIEDYPNYSISDKGRVRNDHLNRILNMSKNPVSGYMNVHLRNERGTNTERVHRLVAKAFIPNPENKPTVNHIDSNRANNNLSNLEWATYSEQQIHAISHDRVPDLKERAENNFFGKPAKDLSLEEREYLRNRLINLNKRPKTEKQLEASRSNQFSDKCREAARECHINSHPPIRVIETGEIWRSESELAAALNLSRPNIVAALHGRRNHVGGFHFEFAEEVGSE